MLKASYSDDFQSFYLYGVGNHRVIVIDRPHEKYYYRKQWVHNYKVHQFEDFDNPALVGLQSIYVSDQLIDFWKKYLGPLAETSYVGPHHYVGQIPGLLEMVTNPVTLGADTLEQTIIYLNDTARWTREQIADWLETQDNNPILNNPQEEK